MPLREAETSMPRMPPPSSNPSRMSWDRRPAPALGGPGVVSNRVKSIVNGGIRGGALMTALLTT